MDVHLRERLPEDLLRAVVQFERWRGSRPVGARIPEQLWQLALSLADTHGISRTSAALKIGYYGLKKRLSQKVAGEAARKPTVDARRALSRKFEPQFVELPPAVGVAASSECWLEFEKPSGARLRVSLKGPVLADVCRLGRDFWEVD